MSTVFSNVDPSERDVNGYENKNASIDFYRKTSRKMKNQMNEREKHEQLGLICSFSLYHFTFCAITFDGDVPRPILKIHWHLHHWHVCVCVLWIENELQAIERMLAFLFSSSSAGAFTIKSSTSVWANHLLKVFISFFNDMLCLSLTLFPLIHVRLQSSFAFLFCILSWWKPLYGIDFVNNACSRSPPQEVAKRRGSSWNKRISKSIVCHSEFHFEVHLSPS